MKYFERARDELTTFDYVFGMYGDVDEIELEPEEELAFEAAYLQILSDWARQPAETNSILDRAVGRSMRGLERASPDSATSY